MAEYKTRDVTILRVQKIERTVEAKQNESRLIRRR